MFSKKVKNIVSIMLLLFSVGIFSQQKNIDDNRLEKERIAYENSNKGIIYRDIKYTFEKWNKKREFESKTDYNKRLESDSKKIFDRICSGKVKMRIEEILTGYREYRLFKNLSPYDSKDHVFPYSFAINKIYTKGLKKIAPDKATKFKKIWDTLKFKIDPFNWVFTKKNMLYPTKVTLTLDGIYGVSEEEISENNYIFNLEKEKGDEEITYAFNDFRIDNPLLKDYVFKYTLAKETLETELKEYNENIESVVKSYNKELLEHPYNSNKKTISDDKRVKSENWNKHTLHTKILKRIKITHESMLNNFTSKHQIAYNKYGNFFSSLDEFDNLYNKGDTIFLPIIEEKVALNYFYQNLNFIKKMKFKKNINETSGSSFWKEEVFSYIENVKDKPFYPKVLNFIIETNKKMSRQWSRKGKYFTDKKDFYNSYISNNYEEILESKK